jgi:hypothetical protein
VTTLGRPPYAHDHYWVVVWHDGSCFSYSRRAKVGTTHAQTLRLSPPALGTIRAWLARVEQKLGVTFRKDRAYVHCTARGGKRAIEAWLRE